MSKQFHMPPDKIQEEVNRLIESGGQIEIDRLWIDELDYTMSPKSLIRGKNADLNLVIIFIRYDGWTLAATPKRTQQCYKTWKNEWIGMVRLGFPRFICLNKDKMPSFMQMHHQRTIR